MSLGGYPSMVPLPYYSLERIPQQSIPPELILRFKAQVIVSESESIITDLGLDTYFPHEQAVVLGRIQPFLIRLDNLEAEFSSLKGALLPNCKMSANLTPSRITPPHPNCSTSTGSFTILLQNRFHPPSGTYKAILYCFYRADINQIPQ
jgi:hypothetical protein